MTARDPKHPRKTTSLNGRWNIAPGGRATAPTDFSHSIIVPSVVDCAEPRLDGTTSEYYWYRTTLEPRVTGPDDLVLLRVEQAQFGSAVFVDGKPVGESIACYTSEDYDLTECVRRMVPHTLDIRVGRKDTLPPNNAAGRDIERSVYTPGVWGDVVLTVTGRPHIDRIFVKPDVRSNAADVSIHLDHCSTTVRDVTIELSVVEVATGTPVATSVIPAAPDGRSSFEVRTRLSIDRCRLWSPDDPFLYRCTVRILVGGIPTDEMDVRFGMREFAVDGNRFTLNGKPIFLRGGNIAFHRFLADPDRGRLPWNMDWVKRVLIDIPKEHHFNFFRFHLGHAYNRWYDLADEHGILLQDEWHFWGTTGTNEVIRAEFKKWISDNANHPSIVAWDPLNESTDDSLLHDIVPEMKELDPTRPWEAVDFKEHHPYIYSLGMTLNDRPFGFTDALSALASARHPVVVNEFLWWWLDAAWNPTTLMKDVLERWVGRSATRKEIVDRQSYLASELTGLFRRMDTAGIQPFVYLSNNNGPTAHWFEGPIAELKPKPLLAALKQAFAPFGVSIELWDRHVPAGAEIRFPAHIFNDTSQIAKGELLVEVVDGSGGRSYEANIPISAGAGTHERIPLAASVPSREGEYAVRTVLKSSGEIDRVSERTVVVVQQERNRIVSGRPTILDPGGEVSRYLRRSGIPFSRFGEEAHVASSVLFVGSQALPGRTYQERRSDISAFVSSGGTLVVQEPEFRIHDATDVMIADTLSLHIERRQDTEKGGYDSYVFPEAPSHRLWEGLPATYLRWFNGSYGGEVVSEHTVTPSAAFETLASCGLGLRIPAVMELHYGKGRVIISRIQIRGRLDATNVSLRPFERTFDPVAARYLHNLLTL